MSSYDDRSTGWRSQDHYTDTDRDGYDTQSDTAVLERGRGDRAAEPERWRPGWNSGADIGLLLIRVVVGGIFAAHGAQKVFGWWGGPGLDAFAGNLDGLGYHQTDVVSAITAFTELVGGILVVLGLFVPLAGAGLLAVAINAVWIKWGNGLFLDDGGFEAELALGAMAAALILTGPGRASLDNGRVWFRHPVVTGWFFLLIGAAAGVSGWMLFHG